MASFIVGSEKMPGSISVSRGSNAMQIRESYEFLVYSEDRGAKRQEVMFGTPGLPIVGVLYTENGLICESVTAQRKEDDPQYWQVTCEFTSGVENMTIDAAVGPPGLPNAPGGQNDPVTWVPIFQVSRFETVTEVLWKDKSPTPVPVLNAAGVKFETPLTVTRKLPVIAWYQFEPKTTSFKTILERSNTINNAALTLRLPSVTFASKTLLLNVIKADYGTWYGFDAWRIEYEATYNASTWITEIMEVSPVYLDANGKQEPYYDDKNIIRIYGNIKGRLDANPGRKKTTTVGGVTVMHPTPDYSPFQLYEAKSFDFIRGLQ